MNWLFHFWFGLVSLKVLAVIGDGPSFFYTTDQRISNFNYPVEIHKVQTIDGYILTVFRIPYSPKETNQTNTKQQRRPVVLVQHGVLSSSDAFILNGPDDALAYLLADAGFDVWLSNSRGNSYARKNVNISTDDTKFWEFSWNEMGTRDLPATIDYVLAKTNQEKLHYVGHSQGTTVFFVLMSEIPSYNAKIKTAHMLAPVAFLNHSNSLASEIGEIVEYPLIIRELSAGHEFFPDYDFIAIPGSLLCRFSLFWWICAEILFTTGGYDPEHLNYTLLQQVAETHPAGTSTGSFLHFQQSLESGHFRKYDYGKEKNNKIYGRDTPPDYNVTNIVAPVRFYYGDNDYLARVSDVMRLAKRLPNLVETYNVPVKAWNHYDFIWAIDVKKLINDKIISTAQYYEKTKKQK